MTPLRSDTPQTSQRRIVNNNATLRRQFNELGVGDIVLGRVRMKPSEEFFLLDLVERGVLLFPSALSQQVCRSKVQQAVIFSSFMLPHTRAIHDQHDMLAAVNLYDQHGISKVVTKLDRKNAGMGIYLWQSIEDVFTQASLGVLPFPFVVQPFLAESRDIRVVVLGEYKEAYSRHNPYNFRNNLHCGGRSEPYVLSDEQWRLCRKVMERGKFPYAHIDLMVHGATSYLAEINLRGGIRGAAITPVEYTEKVETLHAGALGKISEEGLG
ncbi:MAG: hypothetical protein U9R66_11750 [Thermodesulfobacteriota bacterium]|nr:hypothetical protein [Thermodesulfobacteriota bacterium]